MGEKRTMNIYEKMLAVTNELTTVAKNLMVGEGRSSYKAVGEADVLRAVRPLEAKYGIYSYPADREIVLQDVFTKTREYKGEVSTTSSQFVRIKTTYRFVNVENKEEYIDMVGYGDGVDPQDKAVGKAITYSDKYCLLKAYKIITGDDPDQNMSEEGRFGGKITPVQVKALKEQMKNKGVTEEQILNRYSVNSIEEMTVEQWARCSRALEKTGVKNEVQG